jgi:hypothetical protein
MDVANDRPCGDLMNASQERLEALFSISTEIFSTLQLEEVLQCVAAHSCRLMDARVSSLAAD